MSADKTTPQCYINIQVGNPLKTMQGADPTDELYHCGENAPKKHLFGNAGMLCKMAEAPESMSRIA